MEPNPVQQAALSQLSAVPGVVGSLVFDASGEVTLSAFPPVFEAAGLKDLAARLAGDAYFQGWMAGDQAILDLRFGDGHVVVRALERAWLLVLCTLQVNGQLLSMSLTQVLRRLRMGAEPGRAIAAELPLPPAPSAAARAALSVADRLRALVTAELGPQAPQALEILAKAGTSRKDLERAVTDVEKLTRLFISKKKAEELGRRMLGLLEVSKA